MGSMNIGVLGTVKAFRGHAVDAGLIKVFDGEFVTHLDNTYGDAVVCGVAFTPGSVLMLVEPNLFQRMKEEYREELQMSLQGQIVAGNDVDIDWHD